MAIKRIGIAEVRPKLVIEIINDYLLAQGINGYANGLSDNLLQAVAGKLVKQLNEQNASSRVLLNSTPIKQRKTQG